jgi:hypothetical protein
VPRVALGIEADAHGNTATIKPPRPFVRGYLRALSSALRHGLTIEWMLPVWRAADYGQRSNVEIEPRANVQSA